jgi:Transaldolase/Fructose-6-phosphate aldolase
MYDAVARAYVAGFEQRLDAGLAIDEIASVASFFVSRVDSAIDPVLRERGHEDLAGRIAVANARVAYGAAGEILGGPGFVRLAAAGARPRRLPWASTTGTKDGHYSDVKYADELAGPGVVNTMPLATLCALEEHGDPADRLSGRTLDALTLLAGLYHAGIDMDAVGDLLLADGIARFADAYQALVGRLGRSENCLPPIAPALGSSVTLGGSSAPAHHAVDHAPAGPGVHASHYPRPLLRGTRRAWRSVEAARNRGSRSSSVTTVGGTLRESGSRTQERLSRTQKVDGSIPHQTGDSRCAGGISGAGDYRGTSGA